MRAIFADTFYFIALLDEDDADHSKAAMISQSRTDPVVTTEYVLMEVGDAFRFPETRPKFLQLLATLEADANFTVLSADRTLFRHGVGLYSERPDKEWSLTDCISFAVMKEHDITEALTGDHHFEQAGFVALLK
ncbi:MAG TPA: PIN domain-containing protein [Planctomycetota bacterium]|jgi:predicted nucleic acid-binding protein